MSQSVQNKNNYVVIMAGGVGSRFWPLSTQSLPKQFLDLLGTGQTLIQKTYERLSKVVPQENIFILTNKRYAELVKTELPEVTNRQIVLEPAMRNTAPCILLSVLKIRKENKNACVMIAPSDHWIEDEEEFVQEIEDSFQICATNNDIMTLGVEPTFPHTGYGYIKYNKEEESFIKKVEKFTEKPDYETARSFLKAGNYLWNAGIFISKVSTLTTAFKEHLPKMYAVLTKGNAALNTAEEKVFLEENYQKTENISFDYGIMEKATSVSVVPVKFDWNDLGSWGSLYDKMTKDDNNNVIINAKAYVDETTKNIIHTPKDKIVVVKGLENYVIVENEEVLLIYPKREEQKIKKVRDEVKKEFGEHLG